MRLYIVTGLKWMEIGTTNRLVNTGKMIPDPNDNSLDWTKQMVPETEWRRVPWTKEMPVVLGIYDYDPTELYADQMSMTRITYFETEDIQSRPVDFSI